MFIALSGSTDKVKVVSVDDSPMALIRDEAGRPIAPSQKVRPKSEAETYLIDNGHFTKDELAAVTPYVEKSELVVLAWADNDRKIMYWLPNGERVTNPPVKIPEAIGIQHGQTMAFVRQTLVPQNYHYNGNGTVNITENGMVRLAMEVSTSVHPKSKEGWGIVPKSPDAFVDVPFTFEWQEPAVAKLSLKEGETANLSGVQFTVAGIAAATKDVHTTNSVHVSVVGNQYPRQYQLSPAFEAKPSNENPSLKSWMLTNGGNNQLGQSRLELTVCSDAKFSDWHAINVGRKTTFIGFFGHVARQPIEKK